MKEKRKHEKFRKKENERKKIYNNRYRILNPVKVKESLKKAAEKYRQSNSDKVKQKKSHIENQILKRPNILFKRPLQHIEVQTWRKVGNRQKCQVKVTTKTVQKELKIFKKGSI